jgi:hypothetical protein
MVLAHYRDYLTIDTVDGPLACRGPETRQKTAIDALSHNLHAQEADVVQHGMNGRMWS